MFVLTGDGSNGKSSYLKIINKLVGRENTASLDLKELDQRFKTAEFFGKLVNMVMTLIKLISKVHRY